LVHNDFGVGALVPRAAARPVPLLGTLFGKGDALAECNSRSYTFIATHPRSTAVAKAMA